MKKYYFTMFFLCLVMAGNIGFQIFHPAYRSYNENIDALKEDIKSYKKEVEKSFIPSLEKIIKASIPSTFDTSDFTSSSMSTNKNEIVAYPYIVNGRIKFRHNGWDYSVGDLYNASPIVYISTDCFITRDGFYVYKLPDIEVSDPSNDITLKEGNNG